MLLTRLVPENGESPTSYIQRISKANCLFPHDLWRSVLDKKARYPQSNMATLIDYVPAAVLNINDLARISGVPKDSLKKLTFGPAIKKFLPSNVGDEVLLSTRVSSGLIGQSRKYCPLCLTEAPYYRLIWQIKEINFCFWHNVQLLDSCPNCSSAINLLGPRSIIGVCDKCAFSLHKIKPKPLNVNKKENRIYCRTAL